MRSPVHQVQTPRQMSRRVAPRRRPDPTSIEAITDLQRAAGNRVVGRMLADVGPPVVQRDKKKKKTPPPSNKTKQQQPPPRAKGEYGLDLATNEAPYIAEAVKLWKTQKTLPLTDFATTLLQKIDAELKAYGVPLFKWVFNSGLGADGLFDSETWMLTVNPDHFGPPGATTLADLSAKEVRAVVGTLYHEARHTDQDVLIVRVLREQKKSESDIVAATNIDATAVKAISAATFTDPLDDEQRAHAGRMFDVMYGAHKELLTFLVAHSDAFAGLVELADKNSTIANAAPHIATFRAWRAATLTPKVDALKAMKTRSKTEATLLKDLQASDDALKALIARWDKLPTGKAPTRADENAVRALAKKAQDTLFAAQLHTEGEADAYRVEGEIARGLEAAGMK